MLNRNRNVSEPESRTIGMLVICSDTHGTERPALTDQLAADIEQADMVVHAGDFTTEAVLDGFHDTSERLVAVHGNADDPGVRSRLPQATTVEYEGVRIAVTHTRSGGQMALGVFGRSRDADLVVFGHSHQPTTTDTGDVILLNPGSHAQPRGNRPGYAVLEGTETGGLTGQIQAPDGTTIDTISVRSDDRQ